MNVDVVSVLVLWLFEAIAIAAAKYVMARERRNSSKSVGECWQRGALGALRFFSADYIHVLSNNYMPKKYK